MAENKMLSKIRGLLERAGHPGTAPEEREACLAKAQSLKDKYAIEEWELGQADPTRSTVPIVRDVTIRVPKSPYDPWRPKVKDLWGLFAHHCDVAYRYERQPAGGEVARAVGFESDISFAEMLFAMASLEFYSKIEPGWDVRRGFDDNVKRLKDSGKKWVEIAIIANRNGGNPRTGAAGSTTNGAWLKTAYARECARLGEQPTRHTQRHEKFRESFAQSFVHEIERRLLEMRSAADQASGEDTRNLPAIVDRSKQVKTAFYGIYPEMHPDEIRRRSRAFNEAEQARRAALSDAERAKEDAQDQKWWERYDRERAARYDANGARVGAEAARAVDLSGGKHGVPTPPRQAVR